MLRRNQLEAACVSFIGADLLAMWIWPSIIRPLFFLTWIVLTLAYGFHPWSALRTAVVVGSLSLASLTVVLMDGFRGDQLWGKVLAVPLLAVMFSATAWHAHRNTSKQRRAEDIAAERSSLLVRQRQFVFDASHELRTPITIARGHLELLGLEHGASPELDVALDELSRIERIIDRLLLLAGAEQPDFLVLRDVDLESFLTDVFMRWCEVAPRAWRFEIDVAGPVRIDPDAMRTAFDALLENAVKYTEENAAITLAAYAAGGQIAIEVADNGPGIPEVMMSTIFDRFARADDARTRAHGGVGLGLAIVAAIANAHGGSCTAARRNSETVFTLRLPVLVHEGEEVAADPSDALEPVAGLAFE